ncbi:MAG: HGGxSTG domain-containing protein [Desulfuromonadaceae bacterium]|nr:HGGxSTG domain-containing protein [Desulfuromonadaceae bacterium]
MKKMNYPMPRVHCGAKTRSGGTCRQPAMKNGRCRLHGGKSLSGREHGRYRTGLHTKEMKAYRERLRVEVREIVRDFQEIETLIGKL